MSIKWLSLFSGSFTDIVLYIGVAYGHGRQVRKRANLTIRLSSMVLNHEIALVVLMEQLYRSGSKKEGKMKHKDLDTII
ncbi:putative RNA methyltransferase RlmH, tRNA (guanine-N1-)-methyltransferase [Arabidopsis thaliana]